MFRYKRFYFNNYALGSAKIQRMHRNDPATVPALPGKQNGPDGSFDCTTPYKKDTVRKRVTVTREVRLTASGVPQFHAPR